MHIDTIVHIADVHIRGREREREYLEVFNRTFDSIQKLNGNKLICICGDIIHRRDKFDGNLLWMCREFIKGLSNLGNVVVIDGNHDIVDVKTVAELTPVPFLQGICDNIDNTRYCRSSTVLNYDNCTVVANTLLGDFISRDAVKSTVPCIAMGHFALTETGVKSSRTLPMSAFKGYNYALLGDIHKHSFYGNCVYSGSLIQQNHGEDPTKGFGYIDMSTMAYNFVKVHNDYKFITIVKNEISLNAIKFPLCTYLRLVTDTIDCDDIIKHISTLTHLQNVKIVTPKESTLQHEEVQMKNVICSETEYFENMIAGHPDAEGLLNIHHELMYHINDGKRYRNWKVTLLEFRNILAYGGDKTYSIDFNSVNGTVGVIGSNYSGKSSLVKIIIYALCGELNVDHRKVDANYKKGGIGSTLKLHNEHVLNTGASKGFTRVTVESGDNTYQIERTHKRFSNGEYVTPTVVLRKLTETGYETIPIGKKKSINEEIVSTVTSLPSSFMLTCLYSNMLNSSVVHINDTDRYNSFCNIWGSIIFTTLEHHALNAKKTLRERLVELNQQMVEFRTRIGPHSSADIFVEFNKLKRELKLHKTRKLQLDEAITNLDSDHQRVVDKMGDDFSMYKIIEIPFTTKINVKLNVDALTSAQLKDLYFAKYANIDVATLADHEYTDISEEDCITAFDNLRYYDNYNKENIQVPENINELKMEFNKLADVEIDTQLHNDFVLPNLGETEIDMFLATNQCKDEPTCTIEELELGISQNTHADAAAYDKFKILINNNEYVSQLRTYVDATSKIYTSTLPIEVLREQLYKYPRGEEVSEIFERVDIDMLINSKFDKDNRSTCEYNPDVNIQMMLDEFQSMQMPTRTSVEIEDEIAETKRDIEECESLPNLKLHEVLGLPPTFEGASTRLLQDDINDVLIYYVKIYNNRKIIEKNEMSKSKIYDLHRALDYANKYESMKAKVTLAKIAHDNHINYLIRRELSQQLKVCMSRTQLEGIDAAIAYENLQSLNQLKNAKLWHIYTRMKNYYKNQRILRKRELHAVMEDYERYLRCREHEEKLTLNRFIKFYQLMKILELNIIATKINEKNTAKDSLKSEYAELAQNKNVLTNELIEVVSKIESSRVMMNHYKEQYSATIEAEHSLELTLDEIKSTTNKIKLYDEYIRFMGSDGEAHKGIFADRLVELSAYVNRLISPYIKYTVKFKHTMNNKCEVVLQSANGNVNIHHLSGFESFILDICTKLAIAKCSSFNKSNIFMIDEGLDVIDVDMWDRIQNIIDMIKFEYSVVLLITHREGLTEVYDHKIMIDNGKIISIS